jgi:transposase
MRIGLVACCIVGTHAIAGARIPTIDEVAALEARPRENVLAAMRNSHDGESTLLALETAAAVRADERRESGVPPQSRGCLRPDEFELAAQLALARAAYDGAAYRALSWEFHRLTHALDKALAGAQASGDWRRRFAQLERWIKDWEDAQDPAARELFHRTLIDQAIRASLSSYDGAKIYGQARPTPALRAYDEYLFNLMCTADEENLRWLKAQVTSAGWFDVGRYGKAADQAAWLLVQHADGDPGYQSSIAELLQPKLETRDTDPQNFAFLVDRVAVRAGRPQTYATQMECIEGKSLAPRIAEPEGLDARRAAMGLEPYPAQLERRKSLCRKAEARAARQ